MAYPRNVASALDVGGIIQPGQAATTWRGGAVIQDVLHNFSLQHLYSCPIALYHEAM